MKWASVAAGLACLALVGCARFPSTVPGTTSKRVSFVVRTDGALRDGSGGGLPYVYVIALNLSTEDSPTAQGPIPIVTPGGNGIVAGQATHFILWNPLANPPYQIFQFRNATLNEFFQTGVPVLFTPPTAGSNELRFEIDINQLVSAGDVVNQRSMQVNVLTMNNTNTGGGGRVWDALGDGRISTQINSPILIRLTSSQVYTNVLAGQLEPTGDTPDPQLDIADWRIEVNLQ